MSIANYSHAYILHTRAFKETSALLECFSLQHGLMTLVAKGVKRPRSQWYAIAKPFMLLEIGWVGKSELKTLTQLEAQQSITPYLKGPKIKLGLYLNELLMRLLQRFDPHPELFRTYDETLKSLDQTQDELVEQRYLRQFERELLAQLGYGLNLLVEAKSGQTVMADLLYSYDPTCGIIEISSGILPTQSVVVSGASLIALYQGNCNATELKEIKKLMRCILSYHLGNKPLNSRNLYVHTGVVVKEKE